jgi:hypothetical protein
VATADGLERFAGGLPAVWAESAQQTLRHNQRDRLGDIPGRDL